ncbi:MAG: D-alanine--D-alanine ligase [Actinobacteria bacterium]|nr:D-alanine--D-alanine ligase [Actinomycetota bacterium]
MNKIIVAVIMGGQSPEREVSLCSGQNIIENIDRQKYDVLAVEIDRGGIWFALQKYSTIRLKNEKVPISLERCDKKSAALNLETINIGASCDIAFIALHGSYGEDGTIQGLFEMIGLPYTGSGVMASSIAMNKLISKKLFSYENLPTPEFIYFDKDFAHDENEIMQRVSSLGLPLVVKPVGQGSSIGVSIVKKVTSIIKAVDEAKKYGDAFIVEEYIDGREIQVGILGNNKPIALPPIEIISKKEFFDYEAKYDPSLATEIVPADITQDQQHLLNELAIRAFKAIGCKGFARVDMFLKNERAYVSEVNTIPGLTKESLFPKEALACGITFTELIDRIVTLGLESSQDRINST